MIKKLVIYSVAVLTKKNEDPWYMIRRMVDSYNVVHGTWISPGLRKLLDESMSAPRPRQTPTGGLPFRSYIMRKPKPLGTEFKVLCDASTGVFLYIEIQEGKDTKRAKPYSSDLGGCAGCTMRRLEAPCKPGSTLIGDSWFGSVRAAVEAGKREVEFVGVVKTAHSLFPKAWLEQTLKDKSAGSRLVLTTTYQGVRSSPRPSTTRGRCSASSLPRVLATR